MDFDLPLTKRLTIPVDRQQRRSLEPSMTNMALIPDAATGQQLLSKRLADIVQQLSGPRKTSSGETDKLRQRLGAKMFGVGQRAKVGLHNVL